ncbi:hypothetical protein WDV93_20880 [Pantoea ananatis]
MGFIKQATITCNILTWLGQDSEVMLLVSRALLLDLVRVINDFFTGLASQRAFDLLIDQCASAFVTAARPPASTLSY